MAFSIGNITELVAATGAGPFTVSHNNNKDSIVILVAYRDDADNTLTATYNGVSAVSIGSKTTSAGSVLKAQAFLLRGAATGSNTVSVSSTGSIGDVIAGGIISFSGEMATDTPDATANGGEAPGVEDPRSTSITTVADDVLIIDVISDRSAGLTKGASQTLIFQEGAGDNMAGSYRIATTAGSYAMDWDPTENVEDWAHFVFSLKPAVGGTYVGSFYGSAGYF